MRIEFAGETRKKAMIAREVVPDLGFVVPALRTLLPYGVSMGELLLTRLLLSLFSIVPCKSC